MPAAKSLLPSSPLHLALIAVIGLVVAFLGFHIVRAAFAPAPLDLYAAASYSPSLGPPVAALHAQTPPDDAMPRPPETSETLRPQERQAETPAPQPLQPTREQLEQAERDRQAAAEAHEAERAAAAERSAFASFATPRFAQLDELGAELSGGERRDGEGEPFAFGAVDGAEYASPDFS
jgi:hypothetical protein